jgi:ferric-dicitrate binding protein FerR (iron transport regulator)
LELAASSYGRTTTLPSGGAESRSIELNDGSRITVDANGGMVHYNRMGNRVRMENGEVMTAKDGSRLVMSNKSLWRELTLPSDSDRQR